MPPRLTPEASVLSPRDRLGNASPKTGPSKCERGRGEDDGQTAATHDDDTRAQGPEGGED
eukprot:3003050-Pyramimonas_sp.AAC.1